MPAPADSTATQRYKGAIERLYASPPADSVVLDIDEMGPPSVRSYQGRELIRGREGVLAGRAKRELRLDRDRKLWGHVFGAFRPTTGEAFTATYTSRSISTFADFLGKVEAWVPKGVGRVYAVMDNLRAHKAYDVLLFSLTHPRWEFVFQPKYAAYLNLIEPWWKTLRSLAIKGRAFETWEQVEEAIEKAKDYWNERAVTPTSGGGAGGTGRPASQASARCPWYRRRADENAANLADELATTTSPRSIGQEQPTSAQNKSSARLRGNVVPRGRIGNR